MKRNKLLCQMTAAMLTLSVVVSGNFINPEIVEAEESEKTVSQAYVEAMGKGWNLGNTFESLDTDLSVPDLGENSWGNPTVTKEFIHGIKEKGYDSIRIPMTAYKRYSEVDGKYVIDQQWLDRYKEVVDWAVEEGLYVMINLHHDSWIWLSSWDGDKESVEYKRYVDLWEQLADKFKDSSERVCFETINEPTFSATGDITAQDKLDMINLAAYNAIRNSGGNNDTRMIVIPTMNTNHESQNSNPAYNLITGLNDENIIATVHYYSEWVFSANLGITSFDEVLYDWSDTYTARAAADSAFDTVYNTFTQNGIGVIIGEWGLLGYDAGEECNQSGEELKYYDYINHLADEKGISVVFWDNGSGIDRNDTEDYSWKKAKVGEALEAGLRGERSSYAAGLNEIYLADKLAEDIEIPLTLNGNDFLGIEGLSEGEDYEYDEDTSTVILSADYVNEKYDSLAQDAYGTIDDLIFYFSEGACWHEYLIKYDVPILSDATGTTDGFTIPVQFNGAKLRRAYACNADGVKVGPNASWWKYLQNYSSFSPDYNNGIINIYNNFFNDWSVNDGEITFTFEFYDGQTVEYTINKEGSNITGVGKEVIDDDNPGDGEENPGEDEEKPGEDNNDDNEPGQENPEIDDDNSGDDKDNSGSGSGNSGTSSYEEDTSDKDNTIVVKPTDTNSSNKTETNKNESTKLPQTGSPMNRKLLYPIAVFLIAAGSALCIKKRKTI